MKRIFIFGSNGMLGWITARYLQSKGHTIISLGRKEFDATKDSTEDLQAKYKIASNDVLVNAIGITNRHNNSLSENIFKTVNSDFPKKLDILAGKTGAKLIHITTDCVFKGDLGGYWESSRPNCEDVYGLSKLDGESLRYGIVIRTSLVGIEKDHHYNLMSWVIEHDGKSVNGFTNHTWNGITTLQLAKIVDYFLGHGFPEPGLYHIFSKRIVTKYELVEIIAKVFDLKVNLIPYQTTTPILRHLTSEKNLCKSLQIPDIEEQLYDFKIYCKNQNIPWKYI